MFTPFAFQQPQLVTNGLALYLDASDRTSYVSGSTVWRDLSPSSLTGSLTNGPTFNSGNGGSIVFDGVDDYVNRTSALNVGSNFSVFAWIKPGNINVRNGIIGNSYPYSGREGFLFSTATAYGGITDTFFLSIGQDVAYRTAANNSIVKNAWNCVGAIVTNGGGNIQLYVNGLETAYLGGLLSSGTVTYTTNEFFVGARRASTEPFIGNIALTQIYSRILSAQEVLQNFNAQRQRFNI